MLNFDRIEPFSVGPIFFGLRSYLGNIDPNNFKAEIAIIGVQVLNIVLSIFFFYLPYLK